jgi:hypothetical protein
VAVKGRQYDNISFRSIGSKYRGSPGLSGLSDGKRQFEPPKGALKRIQAVANANLESSSDVFI